MPNPSELARLEELNVFTDEEKKKLQKGQALGRPHVVKVEILGPARGVDPDTIAKLEKKIAALEERLEAE